MTPPADVRMWLFLSTCDVAGSQDYGFSPHNGYCQPVSLISPAEMCCVLYIYASIDKHKNMYFVLSCKIGD